MKKTFKELLEMDVAVAEMYKANPELKKSKFGYGYSRFYSKNIEPTMKKVQEALMDIRVENAAVDEKTKSLLEKPESVRGFEYTKEGLKELIKAERALNDEYHAKQITIIPYICLDAPVLTDEQKELFEGCIISSTNGSENKPAKKTD